MPSPYETALTAAEERKFQEWKSQNAPKDSGADYDLRGAYKGGAQPAENGHWPDTWKKPNHPTFSNESMYATGADAAKAGSWGGAHHDQFSPSAFQTPVTE
jgi:hypothetical protein